MTGLFTVDELAAEVGVSVRTVRRRLAGVQPFATMGRRPLYTMAQWRASTPRNVGGVCHGD